MFQLLESTAAKLATITPRTEKHGRDDVVAVSMGLRITGPNMLLDQLSPTLRETLYAADPDQEPLPNMPTATTILRCKGLIEGIALKGKFDGYTLEVEHGLEDTITMGSVKVDSFKLTEIMDGGSIELALRVGTSDVSTEELGLLCGKLGQEIRITLMAPPPKTEGDGQVIDGTTGHPGAQDAGELFAAQHGEESGDGAA